MGVRLASKYPQTEALCKLLFLSLYLFRYKQMIGMRLVIHCEDFLNMVCVKCSIYLDVHHMASAALNTKKTN